MSSSQVIAFCEHITNATLNERQTQNLRDLLCSSTPGTTTCAHQKAGVSSYLNTVQIDELKKTTASDVGLMLFGALPWGLTQEWRSNINMDKVIRNWVFSVEHSNGGISLEKILDMTTENTCIIVSILNACNVEQRETIAFSWIDVLMTHPTLHQLRDISKLDPSLFSKLQTLWECQSHLISEMSKNADWYYIHHWSSALYKTFQLLPEKEKKTFWAYLLTSSIAPSTRLVLISKLGQPIWWLDDDVLKYIVPLLKSDPYERYRQMPWVPYKEKDNPDSIELHKQIAIRYCTEINIPLSILTTAEFTSQIDIYNLLKNYKDIPTETLSLTGLID